MIPKKDLELYLHIPFCRQKCRYCDFLSAPLAADSSTADGYVPEAYVDALLSQIVQESQFYQERRVTTIFWGGGTPSLLRVMDMERLMDDPGAFLRCGRCRNYAGKQPGHAGF